MEHISIDDFKKVEIRIGRIVKAEKIEDADKLLLLQVDLGEETLRQVVSGIAMYFPDPSVLIGKQIPIVSNLAPRELRGYVSHGMILATSGDFGLSLLEPTQEVPNGTLLK